MSRRTLALMLAPTAVAVIGVVIVLLQLDLPQSIAVHWGLGGADRLGGVGDLVAPTAVIAPVLVIVLAAFYAGLTRGGSATTLERFLVATAAFVGIGVPLALLGTALGQLDAVDTAGTAVAPWIVGGFAVALLSAVGLAFLVRPVPAAPVTAGDAPALDLGSSERASWSRSVSPSAVPVAIYIGAVVVVAAVTAVAGAPIVFLLALVAVFAAVFTLLVWRVRVDRRGILVRSILGVPRFAIAPDDIVEARAVDVRPGREFGGWGIRVSARVWGVIVRGGEAIEVVRSGGRSPFIVTVDDAATAAALLTAVAKR